MVGQTIASMTEMFKDFSRMELLLLDERKLKLEEAAITQEKEQKNNKLNYNARREEGGKKKFDVTVAGMEDDGKKMESFYEKISEDHDVKKYTNKILLSLKKTTEGLQDHLDPWKKRQDFYNNRTNSKERYAKQMVERNDPVSNLKGEIDYFETIQSEIQGHKTTDKSRCIVLDNTNIKVTSI
jgi:dynein heavy chain